jgi:hypothetical protein
VISRRCSLTTSRPPPPSVSDTRLACTCGRAGVRRITHALKKPPFPYGRGGYGSTSRRREDYALDCLSRLSVSDVRPAPACGYAGVRRIAHGGGVRRITHALKKPPFPYGRGGYGSTSRRREDYALDCLSRLILYR